MQSRSRSLAVWASLLLTALTVACNNPLEDIKVPCIEMDGGGCNPEQVAATVVLPSNASGG